MSDSAKRNRLYVVQSGLGSLDDQENTKTNVDGELHFKPRAGLDWGFRANVTKSAFLSKAREDLASSSTGNSWESTLKASVLGAAIDTKLSSRKDRIEPAVSDTTESESTSLEGKLNRRLGAKLTAKFDWLVRADQLFYQNFDFTKRSDRDELKTKLQPALTYTPTPTWTVTTTYIRSVSRRVEVNPKRATQTRREEDYTVDFNINHRFSAATQMTQTYSIKALTTLYDYVPGADRLLATQRISTNLTSNVTEKVTLILDHRFTLQDSGPYLQEADGTREFARSLRKYRQELATTVEYRVDPLAHSRHQLAIPAYGRPERGERHAHHHPQPGDQARLQCRQESGQWVKLSGARQLHQQQRARRLLDPLFEPEQGLLACASGPTREPDGS